MITTDVFGDERIWLREREKREQDYASLQLVEVTASQEAVKAWLHQVTQSRFNSAVCVHHNIFSAFHLSVRNRLMQWHTETVAMLLQTRCSAVSYQDITVMCDSQQKQIFKMIS